MSTATQTYDVTLKVNGETHALSVDPHRTLLDVLRNDLALVGTKCACNQGVCGACSVIVDGTAKRSCLQLAVAMGGYDIVTIEGLEAEGELHPVQQAFIKEGAIQCGFCMPAMAIAAKTLLDENPDPTVEDIRHGLGGNLCRCSGYVKVIEAVLSLSGGK